MGQASVSLLEWSQRQAIHLRPFDRPIHPTAQRVSLRLNSVTTSPLTRCNIHGLLQVGTLRR